MLTSSKWAAAPDTTSSQSTEQRFKRKFPNARPLKSSNELEQHDVQAHTDSVAPSASAVPAIQQQDPAPPVAETTAVSYDYAQHEDIAPPAEDDLFDESEEELSSYAPAPATTHEETHYIPAPNETYDYPTDPQSLQSQPGADSLFLDDFTPNEDPIVEHPVPSAAPTNAPTGPRSARRTPANHRNAQAFTDARVAKQSPSATTNNVDAPPAKIVQPVRGDRSATGGAARVKLTEEELAAKLEAAKLRSASIMAKHEKSQADQAAFDQREAEAQKLAKQKAQAERVNTRQMMTEREKNRERKMKSQAAREWETGKDELQKGWDEEKKGRGAASRRGAHGGLSRGGGTTATAGEKKPAAQKEPKVEDFPALPGGADAVKKVEPKPEVKDELKVDTEAPAVKKSWAEQMEATPTTPGATKV